MYIRNILGEKQTFLLTPLQTELKTVNAYGPIMRSHIGDRGQIAEGSVVGGGRVGLC